MSYLRDKHIPESINPLRQGRPKQKRELAARMRGEPTPAEARLWSRLRAGRLAGLHFRRQQPILGFVADFYCHAARLVVEVDGGIHTDRDATEYDCERDTLLSGNGLFVLRFTNDQIERSIDQALLTIQQAAQKRTPRP